MTKRRGAPIWYWVVVVIAVAAFSYLLFEFSRGLRLAIAIDLLIVLIALVLLVRAHPRAAHGACTQCGGKQDAVRSVEGRRLWICRSCGWECTRLRSRKELENPPTMDPHQTFT